MCSSSSLSKVSLSSAFPAVDHSPRADHPPSDLLSEGRQQPRAPSQAYLIHHTSHPSLPFHIGIMRVRTTQEDILREGERQGPLAHFHYSTLLSLFILLLFIALNFLPCLIHKLKFITRIMYRKDIVYILSVLAAVSSIHCRSWNASPVDKGRQLYIYMNMCFIHMYFICIWNCTFICVCTLYMSLYVYVIVYLYVYCYTYVFYMYM